MSVVEIIVIMLFCDQDKFGSLISKCKFKDGRENLRTQRKPQSNRSSSSKLTNFPALGSRQGLDLGGVRH